jgi:D-alanyl-D-alanine carboxypeptidase
MNNFTKYLRFPVVGLLVFALVFYFLSVMNSVQINMPEETFEELCEESLYFYLLPKAFSNAQIPQHISARMLDNTAESQAFIYDLFIILYKDPHLRILVDKENPLFHDHEPYDLVDLISGSYERFSNYMLRRAAFTSLEEMTIAARNDGVSLKVLSAFRSFFYQGRIYTYHVITMGQEEADKISARPGYSQHQLGVAVDFNLFDNEFAGTAEGLWLLNNASRFGWSLSYPDGYEDITGYEWESWHYRYVGRELAAFIDKYFDGIQQYALQFIYEWENNKQGLF